MRRLAWNSPGLSPNSTHYVQKAINILLGLTENASGRVFLDSFRRRRTPPPQPAPGERFYRRRVDLALLRRVYSTLHGCAFLQLFLKNEGGMYPCILSLFHVNAPSRTELRFGGGYAGNKRDPRTERVDGDGCFVRYFFFVT